MGAGEDGMIEDEMAGWHHLLKGHEFEETTLNSERQGSCFVAKQVITKSQI